MNSTIEAIKGGTVFGELILESAIADHSIENLYSEVIIQPPFELIELKNGDIVTLDVHEIFVENKNHQNNIADIKMIVSYETISENKKEALYEVGSIVNETTISMKLFELDTYKDNFFFLINGLSINWNDFISSEEM